MFTRCPVGGAHTPLGFEDESYKYSIDRMFQDTYTVHVSAAQSFKYICLNSKVKPYRLIWNKKKKFGRDRSVVDHGRRQTKLIQWLCRLAAERVSLNILNHDTWSNASLLVFWYRCFGFPFLPSVCFSLSASWPLVWFGAISLSFYVPPDTLNTVCPIVALGSAPKPHCERFTFSYGYRGQMSRPLKTRLSLFLRA